MRNKTAALNIFANVFLVVVSGALGATIWYRYLHHHEASPSKFEVSFQIGGRAPEIRGADYSSVGQSLVMFLRTTCHYCESSAPFYNTLQRKSLASNRKWTLITVFDEPKDQVEAFRSRLNLAANVLLVSQFRSLGVQSTPTALLVDHAGTIRRVWIGASDAVEADILAEVPH